MTPPDLDPDVARLIDQREAQGLPRQVEDRSTLARVADLVAAAGPAQRRPGREAAA